MNEYDSAEMSTMNDKLIQTCKRLMALADPKKKSLQKNIHTIDDVKLAVFSGLFVFLYDSLIGNEQHNPISTSKKGKIEDLAKVIDGISQIFEIDVSKIDAQSIIEGNECQTLEIFLIFERLFQQKIRYEDHS